MRYKLVIMVVFVAVSSGCLDSGSNTEYKQGDTSLIQNIGDFELSVETDAPETTSIGGKDAIYKYQNGTKGMSVFVGIGEDEERAGGSSYEHLKNNGERVTVNVGSAYYGESNFGNKQCYWVNKNAWVSVTPESDSEDDITEEEIKNFCERSPDFLKN